MNDIFRIRHSVRSYQDQEIGPEKLQEILDAADSAPSAGNLKAREVVVVRDPKVKRELAEAAMNQGFITEAPVALVFFTVPSRSAQKYGQRGQELYALQDATIAASFAWMQAVMLHISSCWVGAFDEEAVKEILNIKGEERPIVLMPFGYSAESLMA
ncbi:MAG: nitroreductase family protein [Patescibacteria group bacterium]|nr:nitroreductase family protein [Patescibacteria group bacterium]